MKLVILTFLFISLFSSASEDLLKKRQNERLVTYFSEKANDVLNELSQKQEIFIIKNIEIDMRNLRNSFDKSKISISQDDLIDNTGSLVDVIGVPNSLILNKQSIKNFMRNHHNIAPLIIHEILRVSGIDDDDYQLSTPLYKQISNKESEDSGHAPYCNLRVSKTAIKVYKKKFKGVGYSPNNNTQGNTISFSFNTNSFKESSKNAKDDILSQCEKEGLTGFEYIDGENIMQSSNSNGYKKSETKTTIKAYCFRNKIIKRRKSAIIKEACAKIRLCESLYKATPKRYVSTFDIRILNLLKEDNQCD